MDILVTYFSPTGTTKAIARELADQIKADYFEIQPEKPYTAADLNWKNPLARCNREKVFNRGIACREKIGNFSDYEIVFIGFPIWYYQEPGIIDSFVEGYDWTGKKIILFATSGGSDIQRARKSLEDKIQGKIIAAKVLSGSAEIEEWVDRLDRILDFGEENP